MLKVTRLLVAAAISAVSTQALAGEKCIQDGDRAQYAGQQDSYDVTTPINSQDDGTTLGWLCFFDNPNKVLEVDPVVLLADGSPAAYRLQNIKFNPTYLPGWTAVGVTFHAVDKAVPPSQLKIHFSVWFEGSGK